MKATIIGGTARAYKGSNYGQCSSPYVTIYVYAADRKCDWLKDKLIIVCPTHDAAKDYAAAVNNGAYNNAVIEVERARKHLKHTHL